MNISKYEYKAHKLVKFIFHLIFFIAGFIFGLGFNKASALTMYEDSQILIDENKVFEWFSQVDNWSLTDYPYISCYYSGSKITCSSYNTLTPLIVKPGSSTTAYYYSISVGTSNLFKILTLEYNKNTHVLSIPITHTNMDSYVSASNTSIMFSLEKTIRSSASSWTNYDPSEIQGVSLTFNNNNINDVNNVLDFSQYLEDNSVHYDYDDSIFTNPDNTEFNQYCFNYDNELLFSIIPKSSVIENVKFNEENNGEHEIYDFMFVYGDIGNLSRGEKIYSWASGNSTDNDYNPLIQLQGLRFEDLDNIKYPHDDYYIYLNTLDKIENNIDFYDDYYYVNRSKLLWSHLVPFKYYMNAMKDYTYNIFSYKPRISGDAFSSITVYYQNENITYNDNLPLPITGNFCFYIRNTYNVYTYTTNELGGLNGEVVLPDGRVEISKDNLDSSLNNSDNLFNRVLDFISSIRQTLIFISDNILELFNSMPVLLQSFLITFLVLILLKIIISIITR